VQLAIIAFQNRRYSEAADQLDRSIPSITDLFSSRALFEPRLKILTVLFGWDLDWSWQTVNQIRCEACLRADRVIEAVESHQHMMSMIDEDVKDGDLEWSITFRKDCTARCVAKGDEAVTAKNYETAIELYSAGIELDPSCEPLFVCRSKANLERNLFAAALHDANRVIKLNPSSHLGYQLRNAALRGAVRCNEAEEAFETMFSKLDDTSDAQIQQLQHCANVPGIDDGIRCAQLESATLRLLFPDLPPSSVLSMLLLRLASGSSLIPAGSLGNC
jgi:tetratricopeptide (TPR) repeat protein